jgi:anti-anti-sigma regulatory factor
MQPGETPQPLFLIRVPGPHGPTLRCRGDLTLATQETLRRELALLLDARHEGLVVDLSGALRCDQEARAVILEAGRRMLEYGGRFVVVPGSRTQAEDFAPLRLAATEGEARRWLAGDD